MIPKCEKAVRARASEIGREGLTDANLREINDRLNGTMKRLAKQDPAAWMAKPQSERISLAAEQVMADIEHKAARKVENAQRQILVTAHASRPTLRMEAGSCGCGTYP